MENELDQLRGRLAALDMIVSGLMAKDVYDRAEDPVTDLQQQRDDLFASLQNKPRPADAREGTAWDATLAALETLFAKAAENLG